MVFAVAARLQGSCQTRLTLLPADPREARPPAPPECDGVRIARLDAPLDIADALVFCAPPRAPAEPLAALIRDLGAGAARACPRTALIIAAGDSLAQAQRAARGTGLDPALILATGGMPFAARERARLAARHALSPSQIQVVVIGGDEPQSLRMLPRYARAAGLPESALGAPQKRLPETPWRGPGTEALVRAAATLARAVAQDRRVVLCCGAQSGEAFGIPGGWLTAPVRVGAAGALEPLPLALTLEERSFLNAAARLPADAAAW
jgi:malate/lactate dehydrogenase